MPFDEIFSSFLWLKHKYVKKIKKGFKFLKYMKLVIILQKYKYPEFNWHEIIFDQKM